MKRFIVISILVLSFESDFAGCHWAYLSTSNGISYLDFHGQTESCVVRNSNSSFAVGVSGNFYCGYMISKVRMYYNDSLVFYRPDSVFSQSASLPELPGHYKVTCNFWTGYFCLWEFDLLPKPQTPDTAASTTQTTSVLSIPISNPEFLFYPNPATNEITLVNETDKINSVSFYNSSGKFLDKYHITKSKATIPLNNYPPGIYFIHVATLSDKIIIKKITVL